MNYFEIFFDVEGYPDMWHLDEPRDSAGRIIEGQMLPKVGPCVGLDIASVPVNTRYPGQPLDFTFGPFGFLVVRSWVSDVIEKHGAKIQRFPVVVNSSDKSNYEVILTLDAPKGIVDVRRSVEYEFYAEDDTEVLMPYGGLAPRQKGMLYKAYPLFIRAEAAEGYCFFRPWEKTSCLIVSEHLKADFDKAGMTGVRYTLVS